MDHPAPGGPPLQGECPPTRRPAAARAARCRKEPLPGRQQHCAQSARAALGRRVPKLATTPVGVVSTHSGSVQDQLSETHGGAVPAINTEDPEQSGGRDEIRTDLVEYLIVVVPSRDALGAIGSALTGLVESAKIRILDLVVLEREANGEVTVLEVESIESMAPLRDLDIEVGGMLTEHDLELASPRSSRACRAWCWSRRISGPNHCQRQPAGPEARSSPASASPPPGWRLPWGTGHRRWMTQAMNEVCI